MSKKIEINGIWFNVYKPRKWFASETNSYAGRTLEQCYQSCSVAKRNIWSYWSRLFSQIDCISDVGITGYNAHRFSIGGIIKDGEKPLGFVSITANENSITLCKEVDYSDLLKLEEVKKCNE